MKKKTIWTISVIMGLSFLALLFLQIKYIEEMARMKKEQFDESVKRSLSQTSRNLELNETLKYLEKDISSSWKGEEETLSVIQLKSCLYCSCTWWFREVLHYLRISVPLFIKWEIGITTSLTSVFKDSKACNSWQNYFLSSLPSFLPFLPLSLLFFFFFLFVLVMETINLTYLFWI